MLLSYAAVALIRAAGALFMVSLALTLDLSPTLHGLVLASYAVVEALAGIAAGVAYERFGARFSLAAAALYLAIGYFLMTSSTSPLLLIALNGIAGAAAALALVSTLSLLAEETRGRERSRLFGSGAFEAVNLGGYAMGFALAFLLEYLGMLRGYYSSAILASLAFLLSLFISGRGSGRISYEVSRDSLKLVPIWFGMASFIGLAFMAPKILKELDVGLLDGTSAEGMVSPLLIVGLAGASLGLLAASYVATKIGKFRALLAGSLSAPAALAVLGIYYETLLESLLYLPLLALLALPVMLLPPSLLAYLGDYTDKLRSRGSGMGIYVTVLGLGIGFGEYVVGGYLFQVVGFTGAMLFLAVSFFFLSLPSLYLLSQDSRRRPS
ncbi:MAG: MFS transporter [Acidilobaceae archaeon]|nr:MFS transporter [Acidilobaceae archaeon]MCX8165259.1 MFS transporter [Acidilobaceae archaeon]MDW7973685.1 MFS transporter [Sulfolobales archaeon]